MDEPTCSDCGKTGPLKRGMCDADYRRWLSAFRSAGLPLPPKPPKIRPLRPCKVCERMVQKLARDMCGACYKRWSKGIDPYAPVIRKRDAEVRFLEKVDKNGPVPASRPELGPCWAWTGAADEHGYGKFYFDGRPGAAHRFAYQHYIGEIPEGFDVDHLCRNPPCVNAPGGHLEPVTHQENIRRGIGPAAANAAKTHCDRGHEFNEANTYIRIGRTGKKMRICRPCNREDLNRRNQAKRDAAREGRLF